MGSRFNWSRVQDENKIYKYRENNPGDFLDWSPSLPYLPKAKKTKKKRKKKNKSTTANNKKAQTPKVPVVPVNSGFQSAKAFYLQVRKDSSFFNNENKYEFVIRNTDRRWLIGPQNSVFIRTTDDKLYKATVQKLNSSKITYKYQVTSFVPWEITGYQFGHSERFAEMNIDDAKIIIYLNKLDAKAKDSSKPAKIATSISKQPSSKINDKKLLVISMSSDDFAQLKKDVKSNNRELYIFRLPQGMKREDVPSRLVIIVDNSLLYLVNNIDPYVNNGLCQISVENYKKIEAGAVNLTLYKETLRSIVKHGVLRIVEK